MTNANTKQRLESRPHPRPGSGPQQASQRTWQSAVAGLGASVLFSLGGGAVVVALAIDLGLALTTSKE